MGSRASAKPKVSPWVQAFVYFHLFAIIVWSIPRPREELVTGKEPPQGNEHLILLNNRYLQEGPVKYYLQCTGLWQYWDMFAPDPLKIDVFMDANVTYSDGTVSTFEYPRMVKMGFGSRYFNERYRKFFERVNGVHLEYLWEPIAFRIAQKMDVRPGNPPVQVELVRHWLPVSAPGEPQPTEYKSAVFYTSAIDPAALKGVSLGAK